MIQDYHITPFEDTTEKLLHYIEQNHLPAHERLPAERTLCDMWGCSRATLRSAIQELAGRGVLYQRAGSGTYIQEPKLMFDLQNLDSLSGWARANGRTIASRVIRQRTVACSDRQAAVFGVEPGKELLELTRLRMLDGTPVMIETTLVNDAYGRLQGHDFSRESLYEVLKGYGAEVFSGAEKIRVTFAEEQEAKLLGVEKGTALFYLSGTVCDRQQRVIEMFQTVARPDKVRYSSRLKRRWETG